MDKLILLVGASGSGKTTIAKELEKLGYNIIHSQDKPKYKTKEWLCSYCGGEFRARRKIQSNNVFCTTDCHRQYRNQSALATIIKKDNTSVIMRVDGVDILVDKSDVDYLKHRIWNINKHGYAIGWNKDRSKLEYMHRVIVNPKDSNDIDHINGNKLDNRRVNLRECKDYENIRNSKRYSNNRSGVKGVGYSKSAGKWIARIGIDGKSKFLGYFYSLEEAKVARKKAEVKYHGEFRYKKKHR